MGVGGPKNTRGLPVTNTTFDPEGVHISHDDVRRAMMHHEPEEFERWDPGSKKIHRTQIVPIGIHEHWSGDGHDKLYKIGFPIWAVVDFASGMYLGAWVCCKLGLGNVVFQPKSPDKGKAISPNGRASKKLKVSYILASDDSLSAGCSSEN